MLKACLSRLAVFLLPVLLAACQAPTAPPPYAALPRPPAPTRGGVIEPDLGNPPLPPETLPSSAELAADPSHFKGLSVAEVTLILGPPSFRRRDGDAEIWQYYGPSSVCVLDLFVYPDRGEPRIAHAELRSRGGAGSAATACLAQIVDGRRG